MKTTHTKQEHTHAKNFKRQQLSLVCLVLQLCTKLWAVSSTDIIIRTFTNFNGRRPAFLFCSVKS